MAPGGGRGNIAPFVVGKFIVKAVMGNLFKAPVIVVGIAYSMHNPLAGRGRDRSEVIAVVVGVVCGDAFRIGGDHPQKISSHAGRTIQEIIKLNKRGIRLFF